MCRGGKRGKASEAVMSQDIGKQRSVAVWSSALSNGVREANYVESLTRSCVFPAFVQQDIALVFKCGRECLNYLNFISGCSLKSGL